MSEFLSMTRPRPCAPDGALIAPIANWEFEVIEEGRYWIVCRDCHEDNGTVTVAMSAGETIGVVCRLHEDLVNKGRPHDGLPRYGRPDRVSRGKQPRSTDKVKTFSRAYQRRIHPPVWFHCRRCNKGQRLDLSDVL